MLLQPLTNHFDSAYGNPVWELRKYGLSYREARNKLKEIRDQWKKDHVEIITLDEWIERRKHD